MSKVLAVMIAGLFAAGAYAQNPAGQTAEQGNLNTKSQQRAEARKNAKPQGQVRKSGGDTAATIALISKYLARKQRRAA